MKASLGARLKSTEMNGLKAAATMLSAYKYRMYPSDSQEMRLKRSLKALCGLYNALRTEKIIQYRNDHKQLSLTDLRGLALEKRRNDHGLLAVHSQASQNVGDRVNSAFQNYFEGRARFPRAKTPEDYLSVTYPQSGFRREGDIVVKGKGTELRGRLRISKVGRVRIFLHRPLRGRVRRLTVKREADEWYAIFLAEEEAPAKPTSEDVPNGRIRGGDLGLEHYLTLDDSDSKDYPEYLRQSEERARRLQRHLSKKKPGSKRHRELAYQLEKLHLHISRRRLNWQNQTIANTLARIDVLVLEKLNVGAMLKNHCLAKSISDAAWGQFARKCVQKADGLGKHVLFVDPYGTSQFCHSCLTWAPKTLADREHVCPKCGVRLPRDENSAKLVKRLGTARECPPPDGGSSPEEPKPLPSLRLGWQVEALKREAHTL